MQSKKTSNPANKVAPLLQSTTKPQKISSFFYKLFVIAAALIMGWIAVLYISDGLAIRPKILMVPFYLLLIGLVALLDHHNYRKLGAKIQNRFPGLSPSKLLRYILLFACIVGVLARLSFLLIGGRYNPTARLGDTGANWYFSQEIVNGDTISPYEGIYMAFYPHLLSYSGLLAGFMQIFGTNTSAIIFSNLLFDVISVIALYYLLKRWQNRQVASIAAVFWLLNPLEILYCSVGMSIVVTNMMLILALLNMYLLLNSIKARNWPTTIVYTLTLGVALGVGNAFRPFFIVFIIAFALMALLQVMQLGRKYLLPNLVSLFLMTIVCFAGAGFVDLFHQALNPYHVPGGVGVGWNFFVGANYDSHGRWNAEDYNYWRSLAYGKDFYMTSEWNESEISQIPASEIHVDAIQDELLQQGIDRYLSMNPYALFVHFIKKSVILFSEDTATITWPFYEAYQVDGENPAYHSIHTAGVILIVFCLGFAIYYFFKIITNRKKPFDSYLLFVSLSFCGLVAISLLSEVMRRYSMPISIFFIVFAACEFGNWYQKLQTRSQTTKTLEASQTSKVKK